MPTLGELEAQGFDGLEIQCRCLRTVCYPFQMMFQRGLRRDYEIEIVTTRFRCKECKAPAGTSTVRPWRVGDGQPEMVIRGWGSGLETQKERPEPHEATRAS